MCLQFGHDLLPPGPHSLETWNWISGWSKLCIFCLKISPSPTFFASTRRSVWSLPDGSLYADPWDWAEQILGVVPAFLPLHSPLKSHCLLSLLQSQIPANGFNLIQTSATPTHYPYLRVPETTLRLVWACAQTPWGQQHHENSEVSIGLLLEGLPEGLKFGRESLSRSIAIVQNRKVMPSN